MPISMNYKPLSKRTMKRISLILIAVTAILLVSCNKRPAQKPIHVEVAKYVITDFDPPKHVYVDLKRVADQRQFTHVYIAKHCNNWEENFSIGDTITLTRYTCTDGERDVIEFDKTEINNCLCY